MTRVRVWISEIQFSNNTKISIDKNDIVVLVGPNNAGKSATLKEAASLLQNKHTRGKVLKDITIQKTGDEKEFLSFLSSFSRTHFIEGHSQLYYKGFGYDIQENNAKSYWTNYQNGLSQLHTVFAKTLTTEERLKAAKPPSSIKITTEPPQHPIHFLQKYDGLERKFGDYFKQAFGTDLIVHRSAGNEVPLYVGEKPIPKSNEDRISEGYLLELEKLDLLHEQGDGMRSFVGVLLNAFIANHNIIFIDEPEAFLHPPQARLLGKMLAKDLPSERQLFLATHSEDFLKGLLDANISNLKIIRIQRNKTANQVNILDGSDINNIWSDSLLRHSNILNGLFHTQVVICESDSDCRFFSAILAAQYDSTETIAPDILFIHCGGKHRIPTVIKALKKLNVPLKVVSDFDVLNDINPLKEIFEDLGGVWTEVEKDWKLVKKEIEQKKPEFLTEDLKKEIEEVFKTASEKIFPDEKIKEIKKALKKSSVWTEAKQLGKAYIPRGNATQAFERIQLKFNEKGLLILEVGELESFVPSIGNHGPKWVSEVLTKDLKTDTAFDIAKQFVSRELGTLKMTKKLCIGITHNTKFEKFCDWIKKQNDDVEIIRLSKTNFSDIEKCSGIIFSGGVDIHPRFYGNSRIDYPNLRGKFDEERDEFEFKVFEQTQKLSLPVLAVCRGIQLVNVALGGDLIQDLEEAKKLNHKAKDEIDGTHEINVIENSLLHQVTNEISGKVNSAHHQAVGNLSKELIRNSFSPDDVIEGVERKQKENKPWLLGVQWHPERLDESDNPFTKNIIDAFLNECSKHISRT